MQVSIGPFSFEPPIFLQIFYQTLRHVFNCAQLYVLFRKRSLLLESLCLPFGFVAIIRLFSHISHRQVGRQNQSNIFAFSGCIHSDNGYVETFDFGLYLFSNPVDEPREAVMAFVENNSMNACS